MNWIMFWRVTAIMTVDKLKDLIRNTAKNNIFDFSPSAVGQILKSSENWQQDWTELFNKILKRIKTGKDYKKDSHNKDGMYMPLPFPENNQEFMVVFYTSNPIKPERLLIYDFKIINNSNTKPKN